jgi:hypothetical protein
MVRLTTRLVHEKKIQVLNEVLGATSTLLLWCRSHATGATVLHPDELRDALIETAAARRYTAPTCVDRICGE